MTWATGTASGHDDLLEKFRRWITGYGTAAAAVAGANTGNGTVTSIDTTIATITETWTLLCTAGSATGTFSVVGSVTGALADATVGTAYSNAKISFLINDGAADFIIGDSFTIATTIGAVADDGYAWEQQTFNTEDLTNLNWTRSTNVYTVTLPSHTLGIGESVDVTACSTSGFTTGSKVLLAAAAPTFTFTGDETKSGIAWSRSGTTATVAWTNHGFSTGASITLSASSDTNAVANVSRTITVVNANQFTFACTNAGATSGTLTSTLPPSGTLGLTLQESHVYLKGLGNGGTDEIFVNLRSYKNSGAGYYNIELRGATGFSSGVGMTRINQPGISNPADMCLFSGSIPYWFIANGRRFMIVAKVSTVYESCYAGFFLPTGLPSEYPYPLAVGACQGTTRTAYTSSASSHRAFFNPGDGSPATASSLCVLDKIGSWALFSNWNGGSPTYSGTTQHRVFPWGGSLYMSSGASPIYPNLNAGVIDSGSTYTMYPATLISKTPSVKGIAGDLDGVFMVSGHNNASENIVQAGGVDHLVVQNAFRTTAAEFAAFALE